LLAAAAGPCGLATPRDLIGLGGSTARAGPCDPGFLSQEDLIQDEKLGDFFFLESGNVGSADAHREALFRRDTTIRALQETHLDKLGQQRFSRDALKEGWTVALGAPLPTSKSKGGVGVMGKAPTRITKCRVETPDEVMLHDSGRWVAASAPVGTGRHSFVVDSFHANPDESAQAIAENNRLFAAIIRVAATRKKVLGAICMDANTDIDRHPFLRQALGDLGRVEVAILDQRETGVKKLAPTYSLTSDWTPGPHVTRIDTIFINQHTIPSTGDFYCTRRMGCASTCSCS